MPVTHLRSVAIRSTINGNVQIVNSFHLIDPSGADTSDRIQAIATQLGLTGATGLATSYAGMMTAADKLDEIRVSQVPLPSTPHEPVLAASSFPALAGTRAGATVDAPFEMTATVTEQTGIAGRRYRGRMFLPPAKQQGAQQGELWDSGHVYWTSMVTFVTQLAKLQANSLAHLAGDLSATNLVVYSPTDQAADPTRTGAPVLGLRLNRKIHWLRSRAK